ncbi:MAG: hypothetical protein ACTSWW_08145 [Promethearchaeota archaeon]|jgi:hypothetical protein
MTANPKPVKKTDSDRTEKIYLTMDKKVVRALEIIAGDPRDKSKAVERIINEYVEFREELLKKQRKYNQVMAALQGQTFDGSLEYKIDFLDAYIAQNPENRELAEIWLRAKQTNDIKKIENLYKTITARIDKLEENLEKIIG